MDIETSFDIIGATPDLRRRLLACMSEKHRFYHTVDHVADILSLYEGDDPVIVAAAWFHDIIYDPQKALKRKQEGSAWRTDEALSAAYAIECLKGSAIDYRAVASIILDTESHRPTAELSQLFSDLDMAILGSPREKYITYAENIRREFSFVDSVTYYNGRNNVLSTINKTVIYYTMRFSCLEEQAHDNIMWELDNLADISTMLLKEDCL